MTSDWRVPPPVPPVRVLSTRYEEPPPSRTCELHDVAVSSTSPRITACAMRPPHTAFRRLSFGNRHSTFDIRLPSLNPRRNEDEQLATGVAQRVALEEPLQDRHPMEVRRAIVVGLLITDEDAADDGGRAVVHLDGRPRALGVNR